MADQTSGERTVRGHVDGFGRPATVYTPPEDLRPCPTCNSGGSRETVSHLCLTCGTDWVAAQPVGDEATTLTEDERDEIADALIDDRSRDEGCVVTGPGGTDGNTPTIYEAVERILTARLAAVRDDRGAADQQAGTTVTEWGVRHHFVKGGAVASTSDMRTREDAERWIEQVEAGYRPEDSRPHTIVTRQRTTYPDHLTEWTAAAVVDARGEVPVTSEGSGQ